MANKSTHKGYYAIIPANVRYDNHLKDKAKLIYGEITALANEKGYCWASNSYFAELYGVTKETVSRLIKDLIENGYIEIEMIYEGKEIIERRIYLAKSQYLLTKKSIPHDENINRGIDEKVKDNNTVINNTVNIPPISPTGGLTDRLSRDFEKFWKAYPKKTGKSICQRKWKQINPSPQLVESMLTAIENQKQSEQWKKEHGQYIPNPHTWLNQGRWEDEVEGVFTKSDPNEGYKVF